MILRRSASSRIVRTSRFITQRRNQPRDEFIGKLRKIGEKTNTGGANVAFAAGEPTGRLLTARDRNPGCAAAVAPDRRRTDHHYPYRGRRLRVLAERSTSCDRSRVRRRRWIVISASGAGSCAAPPDASPSPLRDPAARSNSAVRSIGFLAALLNSSVCGRGSARAAAGVRSAPAPRSGAPSAGQFPATAARAARPAPAPAGGAAWSGFPAPADARTPPSRAAAAPPVPFSARERRLYRVASRYCCIFFVISSTPVMRPRKAARPFGRLRRAVESDAPALLQIALPERRSILLLLLGMLMPGVALPVGQRLRSPARRRRGGAAVCAATPRGAAVPWPPAPPVPRFAEQLHRRAMRRRPAPAPRPRSAGSPSESPCRGIPAPA